MDFALLAKINWVKPYRFISGLSVLVRRPVCLFLLGGEGFVSVAGRASVLGALLPRLGCAASDRSELRPQSARLAVPVASSFWTPFGTGLRLVPRFVCTARVSVLLSVCLATGPQAIH